ncbi:IS3 family transposase [Carbonactinospora thermoautotrophica]
MGRPSKYSEEFRRDAVALVRERQRPVKQVARELGVNPETLRGWVKRDRIDRGEGAPGELTTAEREELRALRREVRVLREEREILKKGCGFLRTGDGSAAMKYRLILAEEAHHEVSLMCRVLGVSRAGYYAWKNRGESRRQREDAALAEKIRAIHSGSRGTYGSPRVHAELRQGHGVRCSRKRVARLMREHDLVGVHRRRRRCLTKQDTQAAPAPDLLGRDFTAERPGEKLVGDITYLPTEEGWLYLATVLDLATRKVVGYSMAEHLRAELVCDAIRAAAGRGALAEQAIFHSDRGTQYTSAQFRTLCGQLGVRQSMGRVGSCFDNAVAESFFASLKTEIGTRIWRTRAEARAAVFEWIAVHYNRRRRHSSIGYLTPEEAEHRYREQPLAA